jgi:hypothetical protein
MTGVFREGHNKRPMRRNEPLIIGPQANPWKKRATIAIPILFVALVAALFANKEASAHPGHAKHIQILDKPFAGVRNNYWYDYRSDVEEAENEYRKDLRRAKTAQDRREAWQEYNRELLDAKSDYRKEMTERGYLQPRGVVTVGG